MRRFALYDYEMLNICFAPVLSGMNVSAKLHLHNNQMQLPLVFMPLFGILIFSL